REGIQDTGFHSCSDKIAKWNVLGLQGALLYNLGVEPLYLDGIYISDTVCNDESHYNRAFYERINNELLRSNFNECGCTNQHFKLNKPKISNFEANFNDQFKKVCLLLYKKQLI